MEASTGQDAKGLQMNITQGSNDFGGSIQASNSQVLQGNFAAIRAEAVHIHSTDRVLHLLSLDNFVSTVPQSKVAHHIDRLDLREKLAAQLHGHLDAKTGGSLVSVLYGLGGAGKTQVVLDYIEQYEDDYRGIFWIEAGSRHLMEQSIRMLYRTIYQVPVLVEKEESQLEELLPRIKAWFSGQRDRWLLVLDGADESGVGSDSDNVKAASVIPPARCVHAIVTSRYSRMAKLSKFGGIEVGGLQPKQALRLFYTCSGLDERSMSEDSRRVVETIVEEAERLALAIELAGNAVQKVKGYKENLKKYLQDFRTNKRELLASEPEVESQYNKSILAAWETTFWQLSLMSPLAADLLGFLSTLDRTNITIGLFKMALLVDEARSDTLDRKHLWQSALARGSEMSIKAIETALAALESFSLMSYDTASGIYTMHKLVHEWGFLRLSNEHKTATSLINIDFLVTIILAGVEHLSWRKNLLLHIVRSFAMCTTVFSDMLYADQSEILGQVMWYISLSDSMGKLDETHRIEKFRLEQLRTRLGNYHLETISAMHNLAVTLGKQGHLEDAAQMKREVLEKVEGILGEDHRDTISAMGNLASMLGQQGHLEEAAQMKREVLAKMKRILGEDHPDTISAIHNLASILGQQGHLKDAAQMKREVLAKMKRILGEDHPGTISAMHNLASMLGQQGHLEEAVQMKREVLAKMKRILGEDHPDTISAMGNLANTLGDQGHFEDAAQMNREVLEKRKKILGEDHPDTISAMHNLASMLGQQGHLEDAAQMNREVLEKRKKILGEDHPDTISTINNLAGTLGQQGHLEDAAQMMREVLAKMKRILGEGHPDTINAMNNLANTLGQQGHLEDVAQMMREVLAKMKRILGEGHPDTISAMNNLANILAAQGNHEDADNLFNAALVKAQTLLGEHHPITKNIRHGWTVSQATAKDNSRSNTRAARSKR